MATKFERTMPNGKQAVFYKLSGFTFRDDLVHKLFPAKDVDLQMQWIRETEVQDDDVFICAFPKTGTHWTWEITNMVLRGSAEYHKDTKEAAMLEFCSQEMTSSLSSPRVMNTHLTFDFLPAGVKEKKCKILHVMRNPKDVVVSYYQHLKKQVEAVGSQAPPPFDMFVKMFTGLVGDPYFCCYLWYIKEWTKFKKDNPNYPILNVFYEDLKKDPESEIRKIAKFLDKDISDKLVADISAKCNFDNLKQAHEQKTDAFKALTGGGSAFLYRKGTVGDWKNHLTVAQSEDFDQWVEREMAGIDITFTYQL